MEKYQSEDVEYKNCLKFNNQDEFNDENDVEYDSDSDNTYKNDENSMMSDTHSEYEDDKNDINIPAI